MYGGEQELGAVTQVLIRGEGNWVWMSSMRTVDSEKTMGRLREMGHKSQVLQPGNLSGSLQIDYLSWSESRKSNVKGSGLRCLCISSAGLSLGPGNIFSFAPPGLCVHDSLFTKCCTLASFQLNKILVPRCQVLPSLSGFAALKCS